MKNNIQFSLELLNDFFILHECNYWLEAGTALSSYRDGRVLPWEHDIDIGIWRDTLPELKSFVDYFTPHGYDVVFQKDFPFIDNIIQLKSNNKSIFDIDIYLYTRKDGYAYMRWIQKPEGKFKNIKGMMLYGLRNLVNPKTDKWIKLSRYFNVTFIKMLLELYLKFHILFSSCIYHRFPEHFFLNLMSIKFYDVLVEIPLDIENFLCYRYGTGWNKPDSEFNQMGKWKKSKSRVELGMKILPNPVVDYNIISLKK